MFAIVIFAILPLKCMSSPSVSLEASQNTTVMVSPVQTPADEGSQEPDLISLLQKTLSEVNEGDQSKRALETIGTSNVFSKQATGEKKQKREAHAQSLVATQKVDGGILIAVICGAIWISVAISGFTVFLVHEVQKRTASLITQNAENQAEDLLPEDYAEKIFIQKDYALKDDTQKDDMQNAKKTVHAGAESTKEDGDDKGASVLPASALMVPALSLRAPTLALSPALLIPMGKNTGFGETSFGEASQGSESSDKEATEEYLYAESNSDDSAPEDLVAFAPECRTQGHPDFSGTWKCIKVDGEINGVLKDIGLGYMGRRAFIAWGCGAGKVVRHYTHEGYYVRILEEGLAEEIQEWVIGNNEQEISTSTPFLQTSYWDKDNPLVLVMEVKDVEKKRPSTWTTTRQFFIDSKTFALQTTSPGGHTCRWVYERFDDSDSSG